MHRLTPAGTHQIHLIRWKECDNLKNDYEIRGDMTAIFVNSPKYGSKEVLISTNDLEKAKDHPGAWCVQWRNKVKNFYCIAKVKRDGKNSSIYLHRYLTNCPKDLQIDHINHNTLDNRRHNIRIVTHAQNNQNRKGSPANKKSAGIIGVSWDKRKRKWKVGFKVKGKQKHVGYFENIKDAERSSLEARKIHMPYSQEAI